MQNLQVNGMEESYNKHAGPNSTISLPFEWESSISIIRHPMIRNQLLLAIGIPFGLLLVFFLWFKAWYAFGIVAATLALACLFVFWLNNGRYNVVYRIDKKGIACRYTDEQLRKNQWVNSLTFIAALAKRNFSAAGASVLASSRQFEFLSWRQLKSLKTKDSQHILILKGGWGHQMVVFAPKTSYSLIKNHLLSHLNGIA